MRTPRTRPSRRPRAMAIWLVPTLVSLFLYGIGQGLVKKYISEVPPARFCLYFVVAKIVLNLSYYALFRRAELFSAAAARFDAFCLVAYLFDGLGWLLYFQAIVHGPIAIVGTLSAAYPALTILFARLFLHEQLSFLQYAGVALVILGCLGLSYAPSPGGHTVTDPRWIPLSFVALLLWGCSSTLLKAAYRLPGADEVNVLVFSTLGGMATLGVYSVARGRRGSAGGGGGGAGLPAVGGGAGGAAGVLRRP